MSRPIKFRAWDGDGYMSRPYSIYEIQFGKLQFTKDVILMQFTGITDRNGVEIYEGDVVRYKYPKKQDMFIHIVNWDNQWACFALFNNLNDIWAKESDWDRIIESVEVIGNIYQNPELLEGGNPA